VPVAIRFDCAIAVAVVGLVVNLASALILRDDYHDNAETRGHHHRDHNLRAAYLHVLADALTSLLAIVALGTGKFLGWMWMDPVMGIVGSVVIARWSLGLLRQTSTVLLDGEVGAEQREAIRSLIEADGDSRVADLHVWRVGPSHLAAILSVVTHDPRPYREGLRAEQLLRAALLGRSFGRGGRRRPPGSRAPGTPLPTGQTPREGRSARQGGGPGLAAGTARS